jgi:rhodanese-related sulfurtransferase
MKRSSIIGALAIALSCGGADKTTQQTGGEAASAGGLPPSVRAPEVEAGILIASPERVREWQLDSVPFVLVDARDSVQFAQEHLPGAVNISYVDVRPGAKLPPRDTRIVTYCSDRECPISRYAYDAFTQLGYAEVYDLREGLQGWKASGFPTEIGQNVEASAGGASSPR